MNKVVARFVDGRIVKGITADFFQNKESFHLRPASAPETEKPIEISTKDLKALFFVRDFSGKPQHVEKKEFDPGQPTPGRKIRVTFKDGESLVGTTTGYQPGRPGFFLVPADGNSNTERCFVIAAATRSVTFI
jgi:hypothetical protein